MVFAEILLSAMLSAALQVGFDRLAPRTNLIEFLRKLKIDKALEKKSEATVIDVYNILSDAEEKQITSETVRIWFDELKDAACRTADLLDDIDSLKLAASQASGLYSLYLEGKIRKSKIKLNKVATELVNIAKRKDDAGLKASCSGKLSPSSLITSLVHESEVYGRKTDKEKIREYLVGGSGETNGDDIPIIAITGTAGVGKTTLAQLLYNDSKVQSTFKRAWVDVHEGLDVLVVAKALYGQVVSRVDVPGELQTLQEILVEQLQKEKPFLFVFNDVWNIDYDKWDFLRKIFKFGQPSTCRIVVTTRSQEVASIIRASRTHHLQPLKDQDCQLLFAQHAFGSPHKDAPSKLKQSAEKIIKKCRGSPLVARQLGILLNSKDKEEYAEEWEKISNSNLLDLFHRESGILSSLRMSYCHLSSPFLQQCFVYCSIFPKGYEFDEEKLILLWMAQGLLLQLHSESTMEEVGRKFFHELLTSSFFQQASDDAKFPLVMHDLMNELAQFLSNNRSCLVERGKSLNNSDKIRHVSYLCGGCEKETQLIDVLRKAEFLWTFLPLRSLSNDSRSSFIGMQVVNELWKQKRLRVLSLSYRNKELPNEFGKLRHLRYLDLSGSEIVKLPETISSLYTLQTLILSHCKSLEELPKKITDLINLGHLDLIGTKALKMMPPEFGKLKSLRILTTFVVSNNPEASSIEELGELLLSGKLSIVELQHVTGDEHAELAKLKDKKKVKELDLKWRDNGQHGQEEVLEKLLPHEDIEKLSIAGYGGKTLPNSLGDSSFPKMVTLRLSDCRNCSSLPALGQLSSLQELHVTNMPNCEEWVAGGGYRSLQELYVNDCEKLSAIPNNLSSLKVLSIDKCRQLKFDDFMGYEKLQNLHIKSCDCLKKLPLDSYRELESLQIYDCKDLSSLIISDCPLQTFDISDCPNLESFQNGGLPPSLQTLSIKNCDKLTPQTAWGLRNMTSLTDLKIDCAYDEVTSFPDDGLLPVSLTNLQIRNFKVLKTLNLNGLQDLTLLEKLQIHCKQLEILLGERLPRSLSDLDIYGCEFLKDNCISNFGQKISGIPRKRINGNDLDLAFQMEEKQ